jgi:hypothetical protein
MNLKAIAGILAAGALGTGVAILGFSGKGGAGDVGDTAATAPVRGVRLAACPKDSKEAAKCPGGCIVLPEGGVLCITDQAAGEVDGERADVAALPAAERRRLVVCPSIDVDHKPTGIRTRWEGTAAGVEVGCRIAATPLITVSIDGIEGNDLVDQLAVFCAPCAVSGKAWGKCPQCALAPGGCAAACPVAVVRP